MEIHRLLQSPSIFNHPQGMLKLRFELNMTTERAVYIKKKFISCRRKFIKKIFETFFKI